MALEIAGRQFHCTFYGKRERRRAKTREFRGCDTRCGTASVSPLSQPLGYLSNTWRLRTCKGALSLVRQHKPWLIMLRKLSTTDLIQLWELLAQSPNICLDQGVHGLLPRESSSQTGLWQWWGDDTAWQTKHVLSPLQGLGSACFCPAEARDTQCSLVQLPISLKVRH